MKIAAVWFTCARDRALVYASRESLLKVAPWVEWSFILCVPIEEAEEFEPVDIDDFYVCHSSQPRNGALNGKHVVAEMLATMLRPVEELGVDYVLKIDSDVLALNTSWAPHLEKMQWAAVGGCYEKGKWWGGAYFLAAWALAQIEDELTQRLQDVRHEVAHYWPEDEATSAVFRSTWPERCLLLEGAEPNQGWLHRYDYANRDPRGKYFDFVEYGGNRWKLGPPGNWNRPEVMAKVLRAMRAELESPLISTPPRPMKIRSSRPLVLVWTHNDWPAFDPIIAHFESRGRDVRKVGPRTVHQLLPDADTLIVWNGGLKHFAPALEQAEELGVRIIYAELGWFPQASSVYFDRLGVGCYSSIMADSFDWLTPFQWDEFQNFKMIYGGGKLADDYVLVPLQLEIDLQIRDHSPFQSMQAFIDHCVELFPDEKVVFKRHPRDPCYYETHGAQFVKDGSFMSYARNAKLVYGINSTALLEACMIPNQEVISIGNGFLQKPMERDRILAGLYHLQIDQDADRLPPHIQARLRV